jgi:hypothetical protein
MPVDHLLFESLLPGITKAEDKKSGGHTSANLEHGPHESVLLFHLDTETTRRRLGLLEGKCCDFLYFFKNKKHSILIFVELKGTDIASATEQIANAHQALGAQSKYVKSCHPLAVIVSSVAAPRNGRVIQHQMKTQGITLYFGRSRSGRPCEIKALISELSA